MSERKVNNRPYRWTCSLLIGVLALWLAGCAAGMLLAVTPSPAWAETAAVVSTSVTLPRTPSPPPGPSPTVREPIRLGDTWVWDGSSWVQQPPAKSPAPRSAACMVYDAARQNVVLFGGLGVSNIAFNDTWIWDGSAWIERQPAHRPSPRAYAGMVYDEANQQVILFGGDGESAYRMWQAGAAGCISERAEMKSIAKAVKAVARGERLWTPKQMTRAECWWDEVGSRLEMLTERERQALTRATAIRTQRADGVGLTTAQPTTIVREWWSGFRYGKMAI